jgi:membrane-associated phospholipid phosphatase
MPHHTHPARLFLTLVVLASLAFAGAAQTAPEGAAVGKWKTFVLSSGSEIAVPPPPKDDSAQTKTELDELIRLQSERTPLSIVSIPYYQPFGGLQCWTAITFSLFGQHGVPPDPANRMIGIVHTAMHDAIVATWQAKYTYNRKPPALLASQLTPLPPVSTEPSYPSEHAAVATAAAATLIYLFPNDAAAITAFAQETGETRLQAGANYRSDIEAGAALGRAVGEKAVARAKADGSSVKWTGTVPTGPGFWKGDNPFEPLMGTWKTWLLTSGSQFRPGPPPAFGSPQFQAELAEVKQLTNTPTPSQRAIAFWPITQGADFWERIAYELMAHANVSTPQAARIMGLMEAALADVAIAVWDAKYVYWSIRPQQADPSIEPPFPYPPHPSYPSGAAGVWTAQAEVLAHFFPAEAARLRGLAAEGAASRVFAGAHFRSDLEAAAEIGRKVAAAAIQFDATGR